MPGISRTFLAALTATGLVAGCAHDNPPAAPVKTSAANFGGTDLAWIEITIAMDEQLQPLLALVPAHASQPGVKATAQQVKTFTDSELTRLRALHDEAGLSPVNPHEGMPMPGMVTPDQVTAAAKLDGAAFDTELVTRLREHLKQGESLAHSELTAGQETRTRNLATDVLSTRSAALDALK